MRFLAMTMAATLTVAVTATAQAFCGFYVAKADTTLFNKASQVVLVRDGNRTAITMANDFDGDVEDFAVVIPVPTRIEREQINVGDRAIIEHLDAYTAPRLVEYHDPDPCQVYRRMEMAQDGVFPSASAEMELRKSAAGQRRDHRGELHGRRIRHSDSLRRGKQRTGRLAERKRLHAAARCKAGD